jgi:prephenate dehydrogenase
VSPTADYTGGAAPDKPRSGARARREATVSSLAAAAGTISPSDSGIETGETREGSTLERLGTVAVVGVGLIGGSIGRTLRARGTATRVVGIGRRAASLDEALRVGAVDEATTDLERGVAAAEVVVVCTPVTDVAGTVFRAAAAAPRYVLVTDAGSTKRTIVEAVEQEPVARATFVAAHPIAGSERKGPGSAVADLFDGRTCVLTPTVRTPADRLDRARAFWASLGCRLVEMDPSSHDEALAMTSHLPHAVAAALAATVPVEVLGLAAGAYRDGTRVAGSDAALWAGIFRENRGPLLHALDRFSEQLATLRRALEARDDDAVAAWWDAARARRSRFDERPARGTVVD